MRRDTEILLGDCLDLMQEIPDASIDAVITDPPYAITNAPWDQPIDWQAWWSEIRRFRKPAAPAIIFSSGKFTPTLISSNSAEYRYDIIWVKNASSKGLDAKKKPLPIHEKINVFATETPPYYPQKTRISNKYRHNHRGGQIGSELYHATHRTPYHDDGTRYPTDVVYFPKPPHTLNRYHPTAKPIALCEYLIRTYTIEGDIILDPFCGGGAVLAAALRTGRKCIGIEKDAEWYKYAKARVENEAKQSKISWW